MNRNDFLYGLAAAWELKNFLIRKRVKKNQFYVQKPVQTTYRSEIVHGPSGDVDYVRLWADDMSFDVRDR